jgi:molybdopterin synthase catalytic subunit
MEHKHITSQKIPVEHYLAQVNQTETGAVVTFLGLVRDHNKGKKVTGLKYEAYESMAEKVIHGILEDAITKWQLHDAICVHRTGEITIGDAAVFILTASSHRAEAYEANRYILDRVKYEAPIWKKEFFANGKVEWGRNES